MIYSINEGQQAEEYKARKAKEAEEASVKEVERDKKRYSKPTGLNIKEKEDGRRTVSSSEARRAQEAQKHVTDEFARRYNKLTNELRTASQKTLTQEEKDNALKTAANLGNLARPAGIKFDDNFKPHHTGKQGIYKVTDPVNRHMRRHPEQYKESCGIFYTVTFI